MEKIAIKCKKSGNFQLQRKCRSSLKHFAFRKRRNNVRGKEEQVADTSRDIHVSHSVDYINLQKNLSG